MPRQASIGLPLKESASAAPRQQSRGPVQQQSRHPESIKLPCGSVVIIHTSDGLMRWLMLAPSAETNSHPQGSSRTAVCNFYACWEAGPILANCQLGWPLWWRLSCCPLHCTGPGIRPGNGVHAGPKRSGAAHELHGVSRLGNKAKTSLNGNAPSFVPGTPSAPQQPAAANGGHVPNGHHAVSYRNAAAGLLTASSGETSDQNGAAAGSQVLFLWRSGGQDATLT